MIKWGVLLIPALALAMPAGAQTRSALLSDSQQPGSVIVFPKFINADAVHVDGATLPRTEIELGVVCPPGVAQTPANLCDEHRTIKIKAHWVCPGSQEFTSKYICRETDFNIFLSINGKLSFSADGKTYWSNAPRAPKPPCKNGYLIAWVVDNADNPIKFDGLIGDAVLRGPDNVANSTSVRMGSSTAVSAYSGITIQADPALRHLDRVSDAGNELHFSGRAGEYLAVTGKLYADVKYDNQEPAHAGLPTPANAFSKTYLTLLTLDTNSNHPNNPTFVPLKFYNESLNTVSTTNPLWEDLTSTFTEFLCWTQVQLSDIDANLTQEFKGSRKGVVIAGPAEKFAGPFGGDETGDVTLLGIVHTVEGTAANRYQERSYIFNMYNDSVPVETEFEFLPSRD